MPTFLTNPRMPPELARRIERRVGLRGRPAAEQAFRRGPRKLGARLLPIVAFALVGAAVASLRAHEARELETKRAAFLEALAADRAALTPRDEGFLPATRRVVAEAAAADWPGDARSPLLEPGGLDDLLGRPAAYVRGERSAFADPKTYADAVAASDKDAFLFCLVMPPHARDDARLAKALRGVYFGGAVVDDLTFNVRRLHDGEAGLSIIDPTWEARARAAENWVDVERLGRERTRAGFEAGLQAAGADLLIAVLDEPAGKSGGAGPAPRHARVVLHDLERGETLARIRVEVPRPRGELGANRALQGEAVESCLTALAVRVELDDPAGDPAFGEPR